MRLAERILDFFAPDDCLVCGVEGQLLCDSCKLDACPALPSRCYSCHKLTQDFAVCSACGKKTSLKNVWISTEYSGIAKKLIYRMKLRSSRGAGIVISDQIKDTLPVLPKETLVVPVPTATSRKRQRSFDHAKLIAKNLAKQTGLTYYPALGRTGQSRQVGASRSKRLRQLEAAYLCNRIVTGATILLVDDIVTTGATLESAAKTLKAAGAKKIYAAAFAQK